MADRERFVVRLPILARDLAGAQRLARVVGRSLRLLPLVDPGEITVSYEDEQRVHHRVFCDRLLGAGRRCLLRADHDGPCARRLTR
ncbi:hypothetical protein [Micromonospora sp. NBC_01796]|uniref:hypothetical protein n=1 Tax=Micromonospora sp. NBC_01796 TaxID=2975987 RepID=UPI002DD9C54D|nr:hypothetical protein [Micromonospora sp. NBC_01796]WSA87417.1 hypothetical protein OIE47_07340 [Micromonospora sp. NBC_01796]